jgi:hypothetical protein
MGENCIQNSLPLRQAGTNRPPRLNGSLALDLPVSKLVSALLKLKNTDALEFMASLWVKNSAKTIMIALEINDLFGNVDTAPLESLKLLSVFNRNGWITIDPLD